MSGAADAATASKKTRYSASNQPHNVFENEPFFGQDRMDVPLWRMNQRGLQPRA